MKQRKYISIYFGDGHTAGRKKRDFTIAFNHNESLYEKCRDLSSSRIKELVGIYSYEELLDKAKKEERTLSSLIKFRLKKALANE